MARKHIIPLDLGDTSADKSLFYLRRGMGEVERSKRIATYIEGADKKIVVDTGANIEKCLKYHPISKPEPLREDQGIVPQLAKVGVKPEDIDIVVLTHLHWDHVGNVSSFPNAQFILSRDELRFALDPVPYLCLAYEALQVGMQPEILRVIDRTKAVDMEEREIAEGVKIIPLPGHTPGSIGVVVETEDGPYVVAGDAVPKYQNIKGVPEERLPYLISGIYTDMVAMWKSFERVDEIIHHDFLRVIPGHDVLVFQKERYP